MSSATVLPPSLCLSVKPHTVETHTHTHKHTHKHTHAPRGRVTLTETCQTCQSPRAVMECRVTANGITGVQRRQPMGLLECEATAGRGWGWGRQRSYKMADSNSHHLTHECRLTQIRLEISVYGTAIASQGRLSEKPMIFYMLTYCLICS